MALLPGSPVLRSPTPAAAALVGGLRGLSSRISFLVAVGAVFAAVGGSWIPVAVALDHAAAAAPAPPFSAAVPETAASPWSAAGAERKAVASSVAAPRPPPTESRVRTVSLPTAPTPCAAGRRTRRGAYVCCPSGSLEREYLPTESRNIYYCTGQPNGASCFNNRMCTSGLCRTGKCRPP